MNRCTCPRDGSTLCERCQSLLARAQAPTTQTLTINPPQRPADPMPRRRMQTRPHTPATTSPRIKRIAPEVALAAELFWTLRDLAKQEGWRVQDTYNALGDDDGLHLIFVRDMIIFAYMLNTGETLRPCQQDWLDAVATSGAAETYVWYPSDVETIKARLTQPRKEALV